MTLATLSGPALKAGVDNFSMFLAKRLRYDGSSLRSRDEKYQQKLRDLMVEHTLEKFKNGTFRIIIERVFEWKQDLENTYKTHPQVLLLTHIQLLHLMDLLKNIQAEVTFFFQFFFSFKIVLCK